MAIQNSFEDFREQWDMLSSRLPQNEPDITEDEISAEIKQVRETLKVEYKTKKQTP